ncbi:MAG: hypothetical protein WAT43_00195 [Chitinophagales bacterium]
MFNKIFTWVLGFCIFATGFYSCDNTLEINGDYTEKVVVFGLLDYGVDTNFIRIEKTFLEPNTNAYILATDADEIFYDYNDLHVYLEEWLNGAFIKTISIDYVDGDSLGIEKEEGVFATSKNILYRITTKLDSMAAYKLFIINNNTGDTITSQTNLVQSFYLYYPTISNTYISFADTGKITYTCKQAVNGIMYELWMDFNYYEKNIYTGDSILKTLNWQIFNEKVGDNTDGFSNISYSLPRHSFYSFLVSAIPEDENVIRTAVGVNYHWYAGGTELYDLYLNMLANVGLNQDYISPEYTNIQGGIGMFSSRHGQHATDIKLYDSTLDSIACGSITGNLRFVSSKTNPAYPGCAF